MPGLREGKASAERREDLGSVLEHCLHEERSGTSTWPDRTFGGEVHPEKRDQPKAPMGGRMWGKLCSPTVLGRFTHEMWEPHSGSSDFHSVAEALAGGGGEGSFPK